jgi:hypothetical protein
MVETKFHNAPLMPADTRPAREQNVLNPGRLPRTQG